MNSTEEISAKIADYLLNIKAVKLKPEDPFTWASGWKSPIYCDNRVALSHPEVRNYVKEKLASLVVEEFRDADLIMGVATAGIAPGVLVADVLDLPFAYVRPEPKKHGMGNQVEGEMKAGQKVVVVEDLISTGKSSLKAVEAIKAEGGIVLGVVSIFTYQFVEAMENFRTAGVPYFSLGNYQTLIRQALETGYVKPEQMQSLDEWRTSPSSWKQPAI
jgi:orotate phosphoribosyltransferase